MKPFPKMAKKLLDSDSECEEFNLNVNSEYANRYDNWRRKEELQKLKDKYGENVLSESSDCFSGSDDEEDSEEDDENEEQISNIFDEEFFKIYGALKRKDASIYNKDKQFFTQQQPTASVIKKSYESDKHSMSLKEYHINLIEKKQGITEEDETNNESQQKQSVGYYEELENIKDELKAALSDDGSDDDNELLKTVTAKQEAKSHSQKNILETLNEEDTNLSFVKSYWSKKNKKLDENEMFLRDYILNKRYLDDFESTNISNYHTKSVKTTDTKSKEKKQVEKKVVIVDEENSDASDGEESEENNGKDKEEDQNHIEISKYHFEEPDANEIKRYPRNIESARDAAANNARAIKRAERKERKKKEKEMELQRLRKLKREEVKERLQKVAKISGNTDLLNINDADIDLLVDDDTDFDPSKYDEKMSALFSDQYYDEKADDKKPEFEFISGIDDVEEEIEQQIETPANDHKSKKQKKSPASKQNVGIYEDLIGNDLATRFKYRKVTPNDFGLTNEELLFADEKELNKWVSLKKVSQYRTDEEELYDVKSYSKKKNIMELKRKIFKSLYEGETTNDVKDEEETDPDKSESEQVKKKKKKKKKHRKKNVDNVSVDRSESKVNNNSGNEIVKSENKERRNKRKRKNSKNTSKDIGLSFDRLKAYGLTNRELKKRKLT
ncbi:KRI1-like protein [Dinothrombium tinctorium]|uniref:Protein KRI1 homolog n=1 Tax=Dinothrombium tinctorium TaxID=1965070 RepID=A0A443R795_9ACAR|nr:KRI1-like protein [Dinothrombium tinctorium]